MTSDDAIVSVYGATVLLFCDRQDHARAVEILRKDLKVFSTFNDELYKEIAMLLTLSDFRYNFIFF